jgi:cation diffusion facilitator CzcD-associated flavoprotein CzcO
MNEEELNMELIGKEPKKLKICVVGYGPSGIIAAIGLSKQGHDVTIFERDFYDWNVREISKADRDYMYPMALG